MNIFRFSRMVRFYSNPGYTFKSFQDVKVVEKIFELKSAITTNVRYYLSLFL